MRNKAMFIVIILLLGSIMMNIYLLLDQEREQQQANVVSDDLPIDHDQTNHAEEQLLELDADSSGSDPYVSLGTYINAYHDTLPDIIRPGVNRELTYTKLIIKSRYSDEEVTIDDPDILAYIPELLHYKNPAVYDAIDSIVSTFPYSYDYYIYRGDSVNKVSILDYGIIRIDDDESRHYATTTDIHSLGMALIKPPRSQVAERGIIEKMVNSGLVKVASEARGDHLLPMYYSRLAGALYDLNPMDHAPGIEEVDVVDVYTFYTFGERVILEAYPHHVRIIDGDIEYWYEIEHAPDYLYPSVP